MQNRKYIGSQVLRAGRVMLTRDEARRVDRLVMRVGKREAAKLLGVGETTVEIAIEQGTLLTATRARLLEKLVELEVKS